MAVVSKALQFKKKFFEVFYNLRIGICEHNAIFVDLSSCISNMGEGFTLSIIRCRCKRKRNAPLKSLYSTLKYVVKCKKLVQMSLIMFLRKSTSQSSKLYNRFLEGFFLLDNFQCHYDTIDFKAPLISYILLQYVR